MSIFRWIKSPVGSNDTADPSIDWQENMSPAGVNNSGRAMMAAVAKYRDDIAGRIITTGGPQNYNLTSNQVFASLPLMDGAMIAFVLNQTCTTPVQLNIDSLGLKPLRTAPGVEVGTGQLIAGSPYAATYSNASGVWILQNILGAAPTVLPLGAVLPYSGTVAPTSSFALCFGQAISRTTFANLFNNVFGGTRYGAGDGSSTFNLPDLRGRVVAGVDNMGGAAATRLTAATMFPDGVTLGAIGGDTNQTHIQTASEMPAHNHPGSSASDSGHTHPMKTGSFQVGSLGGTTFVNGTGTDPTQNTNSGNASISVTIASQGSAASNPMNMLQPTIILNYIIRVL